MYHQFGESKRSFYYTAVQGDDNLVEDVKREIKRVGFMPRVFKKPAGKRAKRVDIMLATEALSNAHLRNYDVALLITGDEDYVPLVEEIQRMGRYVIIGFVTGPAAGLSDELILRADEFISLNDCFVDSWREVYAAK
jgi:uncharacterized LabA/DUF88 family protein